MLDWTPTPISTRRAGRLLWLGVSTVVLVTAFAAPSISAPRFRAGPDITGDEAGRSSQWIARPPLRQARGGLGVAKVGRQILAIGGFEGDNFFDVVEARRVRGSGRWRDLAPMPTARANLATAEVGGLVYAIGGIGQADNPLDVVERFDPRSGRWTTSVPLPQPRARPGAAGLGGLLYVAGGEVQLAADTFEVSNSVLVYDPKQNTWRSVAPMPTARTGLRLVASGRYLYAIGGAAPPSGADPSEIGPSLSTVERYDPKSDSWATMNPMVESRVLPCAVQTRVGNRHVLVVVGGAEFSADGTPVQARRTTEVFDPATGRWTLLDVLLPIGRGSHDCATEADGTVLAIGGITPVGGTPVFLANVDALSLKPRDLRSH
jgi:N-acetylneuraminic acid mutarotase